MKEVFTVILIWCIVNFISIFLFFYYDSLELWLILFFTGVFFIIIIGLLKALQIDKLRRTNV